MISKLIKLANHLDSRGFTKEADYVDTIIRKAQDMGPDEMEVSGGGSLPDNQKIKDIRKSLNDAEGWFSSMQGAPGEENFTVESPYYLYIPNRDKNQTGISAWNLEELVRHHIDKGTESELIDIMERVEWISPQEVTDGKIDTWLNAGAVQRPLKGRPLREGQGMTVQQWYEDKHQAPLMMLLNSAERK